MKYSAVALANCAHLYSRKLVEGTPQEERLPAANNVRLGFSWSLWQGQRNEDQFAEDLPFMGKIWAGMRPVASARRRLCLTGRHAVSGTHLSAIF